MHEHFFRLERDPFAVSPDPQFLYSTPGHAEALAGLVYGVQARKGVLALTGEVGTGKTLLLRCLMRSIDPQRTVCSYVFHSLLTGNDLLRYLMADLGIEPRLGPKSDLVLQLSAHLVRLFRGGVTPVLILDEAQNLSASALEEVRLLTNLETAEAKLLQVVLAGQPELALKLDSRQLRQLRQRIVLRFELQPLTMEQTREYVERRLRQAGHASGNLFSRLALRRLHELSGGIPRTLNVLCGNALLSAYALRSPGVSADLIEESARDLRIAPPEMPEAAESRLRVSRRVLHGTSNTLAEVRA